MSNTIDQYREAKSSYLKLRNQAKKELIARFHELLNELAQLQRELLEDFGEKVSVPAKFRKVRAARTAKPAVNKQTPAAPSPAPTHKTLAVQKRIDGQKKKLAEAQTAGKATKAIEDRMYELEDELRLAQTK